MVFTHLLTHSTLLTISLWLGAIVPLLAEVLKQDKFGTKINSYIAAGVSVVVGVVTVLLSNGPITAGNITGTIMLIYTVAVATYTGFWNKTGIAEAISKVTQVLPKPADPTTPIVPGEYAGGSLNDPTSNPIDTVIEPDPEIVPVAMSPGHSYFPTTQVPAQQEVLPEPAQIYPQPPMTGASISLTTEQMQTYNEVSV